MVSVKISNMIVIRIWPLLDIVLIINRLCGMRNCFSPLSDVEWCAPGYSLPSCHGP
uniref:Uncharacterized protein n=1 Tax=Anguilla anguilla TaxID=7936 RepID=A0A0E9RLR0_ANGAN